VPWRLARTAGWHHNYGTLDIFYATHRIIGAWYQSVQEEAQMLLGLGGESMGCASPLLGAATSRLAIGLARIDQHGDRSILESVVYWSTFL